MLRVILILALGFSGIFIAVSLNPPVPAIAPTAAPTSTPCNCPGEAQP